MWGLGLPPILTSYLLTIYSLFPTATPPLSYELTDVSFYADYFVEQGAIHGIDVRVDDLQVTFVKNTFLPDSDNSCGPTSKIIGYCFPSLERTVIAIDEDYWKRASFGNQVALVFHELGHCLLNREHRPGFTFDGRRRYPTSIMHPNANIGPYLNHYFDGYMDELFDAREITVLVDEEEEVSVEE